MKTHLHFISTVTTDLRLRHNFFYLALLPFPRTAILWTFKNFHSSSCDGIDDVLEHLVKMTEHRKILMVASDHETEHLLAILRQISFFLLLIQIDRLI